MGVFLCGYVCVFVYVHASDECMYVCMQAFICANVHVYVEVRTSVFVCKWVFIGECVSESACVSVFLYVLERNE